MPDRQTRFLLLGLTALLVTAARASELDLNGSWQETASPACGSTILVVQLAEDVATGALTRTVTDCGTVVGSTGVARLSGCSMTPIPGHVAGTAYAAPSSGLSAGELIFDPPVADPSIGCGTTPVGRIVAESRLDGTITDDGMGRGVRIDGQATVGLVTFYDANDDVCNVTDYGSVPICSFVMLRNDVDVGTGASVEPLADATVTFDNVAASGTVTITPLSAPDGALPPNFQLADLPVYFDVTTTAMVSGTIEVCLPYPDANGDGFVDGTTPSIDEDVLLLLHEEGGEFVNRTTSRDATNNVICARTASLSQFVFGAATSTCGNGVLDGGEECDEGAGANGDPTTCCTAGCTFRPTGEVCRPDAGECDGSAEACTGSGGACPADAVDPPGTPCMSDLNPCTDDECDGAGVCANVPNTGPCDDGLFCNGADICSGGSCGHSGDPCLGGPDCANACNETANNCFDLAGTPCTTDSNPCTDDECDGAGTCGHPNNADPCDDGDACTDPDTCSGGICGGPAITTCADGDGCCPVGCDSINDDDCAAPIPTMSRLGWLLLSGLLSLSIGWAMRRRGAVG